MTSARNFKSKIGIVLLVSAFILSTLWVTSVYAKKSSEAHRAKNGRTEAQGKCKTCKKPSQKIPTSKVKKEKKKDKKKKGSQKSRSCPFGEGPMVTEGCPDLEPTIEQLLGKEHVECYSKLFMAESTCNAVDAHDRKAAKNPAEGFGLCAIETSPHLRKHRGPNCNSPNIRELEMQIKCCADMMRDTQARYFGTVRCKKTPRCY